MSVTFYTTDEDLVPVYVAASLLPDTLAPLHEAAYAQIRDDLVAMGSTIEQLDALTDASLEALKKPSCHYVMYLVNRPSTRADSALLELAESWLTGYQRALRSTVIESTVASELGETSRTSSGYVVLG
jgi:hypothetical protein